MQGTPGGILARRPQRRLAGADVVALSQTIDRIFHNGVE